MKLAWSKRELHFAAFAERTVLAAHFNLCIDTSFFAFAYRGKSAEHSVGGWPPENQKKIGVLTGRM